MSQARACEQLNHTMEVIVADANKLASLHSVDAGDRLTPDRGSAMSVSVCVRVCVCLNVCCECVCF